MPAAKNGSDEPKHIVAAKRVFDVAKPGESKPDETSRPVIVGHKMLGRDPMVSDGNSEKTGTDSPKTADIPSRTAKKIEPLRAEEQSESPASSTKTAEAAVKPEEVKPEDNDAAVVDAVLEQTDKKKNKDSEVDDQKMAEIQKLIDSKKYFVPIGSPARKRNAGIGALLVLIVLVGAAVAAVDAGLLLPGTTLPFDLIK